MLENLYINSAFFAQTDLSFGRYFSFTGGIRFEYLSPFDYFKEQTYISETTDIEGRTIYKEIYTKTDGRYNRQELDFLPRAALIFTPADNHALKLMYGKAIALPSFFHIIKNLGNPDAESLEPEYLQTIEILYRWGIIPDLNISLSLYRIMLSNLISRIIRINPDGSDYRTWNANAGEMKTNGLELSLSGEITEKLRFHISGSYQISRDLRTNFEDVDIAFPPPFLVT